MLAELGGRRLHRGRSTRQLHRLAQHVEAAEPWVLDSGGDAKVLYLRISEHLVDAVDRAAGNAAAVQLRHPLLARAAGEAFIEDRVDRKSTRLNSSHQIISYAVFCLKKKKNTSADK